MKKELRLVPSIVLDYCRSNGYTNSSLQKKIEPEYKRFDSNKIYEIGLDTIDAIRCVSDKKRTDFFLKEIDLSLKPGDRVLEAGIGTGILSFAATMKGARVDGIEINKTNFRLANKIKKYLEKKFTSYSHHLSNVVFHLGNALNYHQIKKYDAIISENIYTGMFYEKQVQITNYLTKKLLKPDGIVIPNKMFSYVAFCGVSKIILKNKPALIVVNEIKNNNYRLLSSFVKYSQLDFSIHNNLSLDFKGRISATSSGVINSLYIKARVFMPSGKYINGSSTDFFTNDIIIPIKKPFKANKGDHFLFRIKYNYGDNPDQILLDAAKI